MKRQMPENRVVTARGQQESGRCETGHSGLQRRISVRGNHMKRTAAALLALFFALTVGVCAADTGFSDVPERAWYAEAIHYVREKGLMNGTGNNMFSPDTEISRAMVAAVLYRNAGSPSAAGISLPADIPDGWYRDAAVWALESGVLTVDAGGRFNGNGQISRELLANALWVSAGRPSPGEAVTYADSGEITATDAVSWAKNAGLMNGVGGNRFDPSARTTRAVLATILMRLDSLPKQGEKKENGEMTMKINDTAVSVAWESNASVTALRELAANGPLTVNMSMYGGFEQVGALGASLPRSDEQTTTSPGDIVLYSGNQIVVFYGSNSWAYTRLGKITGLNAKELRTLLGSGNVTLTLE